MKSRLEIPPNVPTIREMAWDKWSFENWKLRDRDSDQSYWPYTEIFKFEKHY